MIRNLLVAIALFTPLSAYSQQGPGPVASVRPSDPDWKSVLVSVLDGQLIGVKKAGESFYFTPTPVVDWESFSTSVANVCESADNTEKRPAEINVQYYHPLILMEIAEKAEIALNTLSVVPHFGHSVFLRDTDNKYHMMTTLDVTTLLQGEAMSTNRPLLASERLIVKRPCALLRDFADSRSLKVAYHALGQNFETASINAEILMSQTIDTFFDTSDGQEQVDQTSINVTSSGGGLAIDVGPISFNTAKADQNVVTNREFNRAINRNWLSERAEDTLQTIDIEEICGPEHGCLEDDLRQMIVDFALQGAEERRLDFRERADGLLDIFLGQTNVGRATRIVDQTVKATLNTIFANASEEEQSGEFAGFKGTYKKKDNNTLTINGNSEFTRKGEEWIPTSLMLHLVDTTKVQDRIRAGYTRTVLQDKVFVSYQVQDAFLAKLPEGFIQGRFYNLYLKALSDLAAQSIEAQKWRDYYTTINAYSIRASAWQSGADFHIGCSQRRAFNGSAALRKQKGKQFCRDKKQKYKAVVLMNHYEDPGSSCWTSNYALLCTGTQ